MTVNELIDEIDYFSEKDKNKKVIFKFLGQSFEVTSLEVKSDSIVVEIDEWMPA